MNAQTDLSDSLKYYINDEYGLGLDVQFKDSVSGTEYITRVIKQEEENNDTRNRKNSPDEIVDKDVFLIDLPIEPKKNDTFVFGSITLGVFTPEDKLFIVDYYSKVAIDVYRIYVVADKQQTPRTKRMTL